MSAAPHPPTFLAPMVSVAKLAETFFKQPPEGQAVPWLVSYSTADGGKIVRLVKASTAAIKPPPCAFCVDHHLFVMPSKVGWQQQVTTIMTAETVTFNRDTDTVVLVTADDQDNGHLVDVVKDLLDILNQFRTKAQVAQDTPTVSANVHVIVFQVDDPNLVVGADLQDVPAGHTVQHMQAAAILGPSTGPLANANALMSPVIKEAASSSPTLPLPLTLEVIDAITALVATSQWCTASFTPDVVETSDISGGMPVKFEFARQESQKMGGAPTWTARVCGYGTFSKTARDNPWEKGIPAATWVRGGGQLPKPDHKATAGSIGRSVINLATWAVQATLGGATASTAAAAPGG